MERIAEEGSYRLPSVAPHYYPKEGFNPLFDRLLDGFTVHYNVAVRGVEASPNGPVVHFNGTSISADLVIATSPLDEFLGCEFGELEWRGYRLELSVEKQSSLGHAPDCVPFAWVYTPWQETPVCRATDFGVIHQGSERSGRRSGDTRP